MPVFDGALAGDNGSSYLVPVIDHLQQISPFAVCQLGKQKVRIVLEGFRREVAVNELCRREGIKPGAYYAWTKDFMEAGKERLTRDTIRDATR